MDKTHHDLRDAFAADGCPVCALTNAGVARYFQTLNYEAAGDRGVRARLRESLGFCPPHARQWLGAAHVLATATVYAEVLAQTRDDLRARTFRRSGPRLPAILRVRSGTAGADDASIGPPRATAPCPACVVRDDSERMLLTTLLTGLTDRSFRADFAAGSGLCLPHLRRGLARAPDATSFTALRDTALAHEDALFAHLLEVIRKHDYRFTEELAGEERGAGARTIHHVTGEPDL